MYTCLLLIRSIFLIVFSFVSPIYFTSLASQMDSRQEWCRLREYVEGLEEERRKILAFERELPLCLQLVTHAIEICKQQIGMNHREYSDCEGVSSEERVMEEFIPMKTNPCMEDGHHKANEKDHERGRAGKRDWLNSAQLWNTQDHHNHPSPQDKGEPMGIARKKEAKQSMLVPSSTTNCCDKERQIMINKKTRRCWSPDLHKSFLQSLQQLGGAHVATPKQIREVMRVDGLTNDEVKSHLQKYRLHTARRPSPTTPCKSTPPSAQFVVVGDLWIPPPEYAPANAGAVCTECPGNQREPTDNACTNKSYTPVARVHQCKQQSSPVPRTNIGVCSFRSDLYSSSSATSNSSHAAPTSFCIH